MDIYNYTSHAFIVNRNINIIFASKVKAKKVQLNTVANNEC